MDMSINSVGAEAMASVGYTATSFESDSFQSVLDSMVANGDEEGLKQACIDFESYFLNMMMKTMRNTISYDEDGLFSKSSAEETFQEMLDEELMNNAASTGGFGIADMMYKQLSSGYASSSSSYTDFSV